MEQITPIENKEILEKSITKNFFKIWITKEIIHRPFFENYYKSFLDKNDNFSIEKFEKTLNSIYNLISNSDTTSIRPNNINKLGKQLEKKESENYDRKLKEKIKIILSEFGDNYIKADKFTEDLITLVEGGAIIMLEDELSDEKNKKVVSGITDYLIGFFSESVVLLNIKGSSENVEKILEEMIQKIIEILRN